jgi:hypothetical protein
MPDATLPNQNADPNGPVYPRWSWDVAAQGQATAAVAPGTAIGRKLMKEQQQRNQGHKPGRRMIMFNFGAQGANGLRAVGSIGNAAAANEISVDTGTSSKDWIGWRTWQQQRELGMKVLRGTFGAAKHYINRVLQGS